MAWLSRLDPETSYLEGIALPMALIGTGQGSVLGPLTAGGLNGVAADHAGAAGGVTNVAHQIGGSLGLALLVAVFAAADSPHVHGSALLSPRIAASLTAGTALLACALIVTVVATSRRSSRRRETMKPRRSGIPSTRRGPRSTCARPTCSSTRPRNSQQPRPLGRVS
jgi:hypothetical protein